MMAIIACYAPHQNLSFVDAFVNPTSLSMNFIKPVLESPSQSLLFASAPLTAGDDNKPPAPVLNGKRILPVKIMLAGLKGHQLAAAYAILSPEYKKAGGGTDGWEACQHVGVTRDLAETIKNHLDEHGKDRVAHVRALSFLIPNENAMESIASEWRREAMEVKGMTNFDPILAAMDIDDFLEDDDDDDFDDDDDDDYFDMMAGAMSASRRDTAPAMGIEETQKQDENQIVSPFDQPTAYATTDGESLLFNKENVDTVLDEIRPYLISDGGNVSVDSVDEATKNVYLKLEGACGSCPSSTITMQMGIERVLKENFADLGEVLQVEDEGEQEPKELTYQTVEKEVNRIRPAILAMGGLVDILEVDAIGTIKLRFRGANKVRQGLEMALLDIDFVKHIEFVME
jgi:Fe-S cluster biogenesis protein NfuA